MDRNPAKLYKTMVVGIIILFVGLAVQPGVATVQPLEIDKNYIEYSTEVYGFNSLNRTVKLTTEEAEEVEKIFESIRLKINESNSKKEAEKILFKSIVELDKYDLLAGLSVRQAQRLISYEYGDINKYNPIHLNNYQNNNSSQILENFNCIFVASLTNCSLFFQNGSTPIFLKVFELIYKLHINFYLTYVILFFICLYLFFFWLVINHYFIPYTLWPVGLYIGSREGGLGDYPSEGWIWTIGKNLVVKYNGRMIGDIERIYWSGTQWGYCGVRDFKGFKIYGQSSPKKFHLLGRAGHMRIKSVL